MAKLYPEATVGGLIVGSKGRVLIVRSPKWRMKFTVPGGHIEPGERAEDALVREVKEETGLNVHPVRLLLVQEAIYPKDFHLHRHYIFLDYLCKRKSRRVRLDGRELVEYRWVEPEKALRFNLEPYARRLIREYLADKHKA